MDRLHTIPDLLHKVQDTLEMIVVTGERLKKYVMLIHVSLNHYNEFDLYDNKTRIVSYFI